MEDREWLTQFFNDIMLCENGIYTLWGSSKPITMIQVDTYSDAERKSFCASISEEEKKKCLIIYNYNLHKTWEKWEQISNRFPIKRYMLFKKDLDGDQNTFFVVFVDILKTATMIQDNYEAFRRAVGFDFHSLEVVLEMTQKDSIFWRKIEHHAHLSGLLYGFGNKNSYLFQWKYFDHPKSCDDFCDKIKFLSSNELTKGHIKYTIDNFGLPSFASFNEIDDVIDRYKEERIKIKEIYKENDFLDLTLKKLTS